MALEFPLIDPVAVALGPIVIRWYALAYLAGILLGWRYAVWLVTSRGGRPDKAEIDDFMNWAIVGIILGGRLGYVLFYNAGYYLDYPLEALKIWQGGMSFHGGVVGVFVAMLVFARKRGVSFLRLTDVITAAAPIGLFFGRLANFVNAELYGRVSDAPWAMVFPNAGPLPRHPSQLYEAALEGVVLFIILFVLARMRLAAGIVSGAFLAGYGIFRGAIEFVREPDAHLGEVIMGLSMGQLLSVPMIIVGAGAIIYAVRQGDERA